MDVPNRSSAPADQPLIVLQSVGRVFPTDGGMEVKALADVSLRIGGGEFVCIAGPSGSGKSTLLAVIGALDRPSSGGYRFAGRSVADLDEEGLADLRLAEMGFVFQHLDLLETLSAQGNVELPATYVGMGGRERARRARAMLERVGLADRARHRPGELSGGERQRVCVARALAGGARLLVADEPTGALDSAAGADVLALLKAQAERGCAVVVASHDARVAECADRVITLRDGRVTSDSGAPPRGDRAAMPAVSRVSRRPLFGAGALGTAARSLGAGGLRAATMALAAATSVCAVVVLLGLTKGAFASAAGVLADMGANRISVSAATRIYDLDSAVPAFTPVEPIEITEDDVERIAEGVANVASVSIGRGAYLGVARGDRQAAETTVQGTTDGPRLMLDVPWPLESGAWLTAADGDARSRATVIGPTVRDRLFNDQEDPLGQIVLVDGRPFTVKGVLGPIPDVLEPWVRRRGAGQHTADETRARLGLIAYVPFQTGKALLFPDRKSTLTVAVVNPEAVEETAEEIRDLLIRSHGRDGVIASVHATLAESYASMTGLNTALTAGIGGGVLLAAGLVVALLQTASLGARRREIGLRLAVGARRGDLAAQFLTEAGVVMVGGGAVGVVLAYLARPLVESAADLPVAYAPWFALAAVGCAVAVGLVFGSAPARRAARTNPSALLASP